MQMKRRPSGKKASIEAAERRALAKQAAKEQALRLRGQVLVNVENLRPTGSYSTPDFVTRGFYADRPFTCKDCRKTEIWTATQQKWWYESAKGDVWTTAIRCRPCRRREQERKGAARKVHLAGLAAKRGGT
jgi:putative zinc ribbon protein